MVVEEQSTSNANQVPSKLVKFNLPEFNSQDPETWFVAVEIIFTSNKVTADEERFSYLLQHLDSQELVHLRDILTSKAANRYEQSKKRLIQVHGKSRTEQLTQLLRGASIPTNCKPSIILANIKHYAGVAADTPEMKDILHSIWIQKLPTRTREILAPSSNQPLEKQAEIADILYETYECHNNQIAAVSNTSVNPQTMSTLSSNSNSVQNSTSASTSTPAVDFSLLLSMMSSMQAQISAIAAKQEERSRSRQRSPTPYNARRRYSRNRSRNASESRAQFYDGECWYHNTFGQKARKCIPGCKKAGNEQ